MATGLAGVGRAIPSSASFFSTVPAMTFSLSMQGPGRGDPVFADRAPSRKPPAKPRPAATRVRHGAVAAGGPRSYVAPQACRHGGSFPMTIPGRCVLGISAALVIAVAAGVEPPRRALAATIELASHRAIYELKLAESHGNSSTVSARGRILYDFSGNACEGYALQFRQVSELDNGEGKVTLSDLRSTTWEDGAAKKFIFKSQNYLNETLLDSVDGEAERQRDKVAVTLNQPVAKTFDLEAGMVFPTDHMRRIIAAAREGKNILELPVYDGSEKGEKVYDTLTVIDAEIAPN